MVFIRRTKKLEETFRKAQALAEDIKEMETIDVHTAFNRVRKQIRRKQYRSMMDSYMKYAAILTLPFMLTTFLLGYPYFQKPETTVQYAEVTAAAGAIIHYELPDRSEVWLNAGTTLRYPTAFQEDQRNVGLNGEVYFEVRANKEYPFYVNTPNGPTIYVYGTKFNVTAYADDTCMSTVLEQGNINAILPAKGIVNLTPGEQLFYDKT